MLYTNILNCAVPTDKPLCGSQVFISINIKNVHWYLMVINAKKRRVQYLDSLKDLLGHADADFVVCGQTFFFHFIYKVDFFVNCILYL